MTSNSVTCNARLQNICSTNFIVYSDWGNAQTLEQSSLICI